MSITQNILSPGIIAQLAAPRDIYHSWPKLLVRTLFAAVFAALFCWAGWKLTVIDPADEDRIGYWAGVVAGLSLSCLSIIPALPGLRAGGRPAVTISKAGLAFAGQPLVPWAMIAETSWHTVTFLGFLPIMSAIRLHGADDGPIPVLGKTNYTSIGGRFHSFDSSCLACGSKAFLDYCNLYEAAGRQEAA